MEPSMMSPIMSHRSPFILGLAIPGVLSEGLLSPEIRRPVVAARLYRQTGDEHPEGPQRANAGFIGPARREPGPPQLAHDRGGGCAALEENPLDQHFAEYPRA